MTTFYNSSPMRIVFALALVIMLSACIDSEWSYRDRLVVDVPIPAQANDNDAVRQFVGGVWRVTAYWAVWFSRADNGYVAHWVNTTGEVDLAGLLSEAEEDELRSGRVVSNKDVILSAHKLAKDALSDTGLPSVPFDLIAVGEDALLQSRYGKLVFVQYLHTEPGGRRIRFFQDIHPGAWIQADRRQGWWVRAKRAVGYADFQVRPNRAMLAGFRGGELPRARVSFSGGGEELLTFIRNHGSSLFNASDWPHHSSDQSILFERTSLEVPRSSRDSERIAAIVAHLNGQPVSEAAPDSGTSGYSPGAASATTQSGSRSDDGLTALQWAESFANPERGWGLNLTSSQTVRCHAAQARQASADPSADLLLSVAASKTVAVYVHGLNVFSDGAQPSLDELEQDWRKHVAVLKASSPSWGYCLVAWNTEQGVTDEQTQLPYLLFALRTLSDHAELFDPDRRVTVVAHSAGGLYAEHAWLKLQSTEVTQSKFNPLRGAPDTPTQLVTLGTPHQGAAFAESARKMSEYFPLVMKMSNVKLNDQAMALLQQHMLEKANYRGVVQMRAVADNPWLSELNANFAQATPPDQLVALGGSADPVVSAVEARSAVGRNHVLDGYDHQMLLAPKDGFAQLMSGLYVGSL